MLKFHLDGPRMYLYIILWVIGLPSTICALNIESDQQLKYANALFLKKQYLRAAEEFQRFAFFFPDHPQNRAALYKAGESFLLAKDPKSAIAILKPLSSTDPPDDLAIEAFFKIAECHLSLNQPTQAVFQLNNIIATIDDAATRDRAYYRIGWIQIEYGNWTGAQAALTNMTRKGQQHSGGDNLSQALTHASAIPSKSPIVAGTLSILPGAGQLYCRRPEDAFIAFIVNIGLIWAAHDAFENEQYGLGGLISFVGVGFYVGNIYGAVNDAQKYNRQQNREFIDRLKQFQVNAPPPLIGATGTHGPMVGLKIRF